MQGSSFLSLNRQSENLDPTLAISSPERKAQAPWRISPILPRPQRDPERLVAARLHPHLTGARHPAARHSHPGGIAATFPGSCSRSTTPRLERITRCAAISTFCRPAMSCRCYRRGLRISPSGNIEAPKIYVRDDGLPHSLLAVETLDQTEIASEARSVVEGLPSRRSSVECAVPKLLSIS